MREVNGGSQGSIWVTMIANADLDAGIFSDVCYEYETARRKLPDPLDDLIADIIIECRDRKYLEASKLEQHMKYHAPKAGEVMKAVTGMGAAGAVAIPLAKMVASGTITRDENERRLTEVLAYDKGEVPKPEWLDAVISTTKAKNRVFR